MGAMRKARIKIPASEAEAAYHCTSRTVNGEWLFDDGVREILRRQIWQVADYCGVQVLTYSILSNHFHVLVRVPKQQPLADAELLRRYRVLYPKPTAYQNARLDAIVADLSRDGPDAVEWRKRQMALMGDVSQYMKLLKQRFSIWFNKSHQRFGTLWAERFKSQLVESDPRTLQTVAAYIDLNCVRAGLVTDPKDYRFCGYAEAVAGNLNAQAGVVFALGGREWNQGKAQYRELLFGSGSAPREGAAAISHTELNQVVAQGGTLPLATVLRCKLRYFTDGAVLGSRTFVEKQFTRSQGESQHFQKVRTHPLPACTDWGDLVTLRALRRHSSR
jgi:putative transposase